MGITRTETGTFVPISSREICPVCGSREGRCAFFISNETNEIAFYRCKEKESNRSSGGWFTHTAEEVHGYSNSSNYSKEYVKKKLEEYKQKEISEEDIILWDKVYREFRRAFKNINGNYLYKHHLEYLENKGFSKEDINNMMFFSVPQNEKINYENYQCTLPTAITKELLKKFSEEDLLRVPGFSIRRGKKGDFVGFLNAIKSKINDKLVTLDAIFIPYLNKDGNIQGMQYRLTNPEVDDKGKKIRYRWYSSFNVTCGSPIDYFVPTNLENEDIILLTEGVLKARYAATKLKIRSLAEAGVGNYRSLIKSLQDIERKENKKYNVILALDMDKYSNPDVLRAEIRTLTTLSTLGYNITILEWNVNDGKGIDDKIFKSGISDFRYISI